MEELTGLGLFSVQRQWWVNNVEFSMAGTDNSPPATSRPPPHTAREKQTRSHISYYMCMRYVKTFQVIAENNKTGYLLGCDTEVIAILVGYCLGVLIRPINSDFIKIFS